MDLKKQQEKLINIFGLYVGLLSMLMFLIHVADVFFKNKSLANSYEQFSIFFISILLLFSRKYNWGKYIQIGIIILVACATSFTSPTGGFQISIVFILILLSQKYGLLRVNGLIKVVIGFVLFISVNITGLFYYRISLTRIVPLLTFSMLFSGTFIVIKSTEISEYFEKERKLKQEIESLKYNLKTVTKINNPNDYDFTPAEMILLQNLCLYKESNKQLGERLNKSEHTIKSQLRSILNKTEICGRYELIEQFKNYFVQKPEILLTNT